MYKYSLQSYSDSLVYKVTSIFYIPSLTLLLLLSLFVQATLANEIDAQRLYEQGYWKQATKLLHQQPKSEAVLLLLAKIQFHYDLDQAEKWIEQAYKTYPNSAEVHFLRGEIMAEQASHAFFSALSYAQMSLFSFEKAVELAPEQIKYRHALLQFHLFAPAIAGGDKQLALQQVEQIKQLNTVEGELADLLRLLTEEQEEQVQHRLTSLIEQNPDTADYYHQAGLLYQEEKNYPQAFVCFEYSLALLQKKPHRKVLYYSALYQLASTSLLSKTQLPRAERQLREYIQSAPKTDELPQVYWAQLRLAKVLALQGKSEQAQKLYAKLNSLEVPELKEQLKQQS